MGFPVSSPSTTTGPGHVVGIDLGGSYTRALLCDGDGRELAAVARATPSGSAADVLDVIAAACRDAARDGGVGWDRIASVAIGVPGVAEPATGALHLAPNLPSFDGVDLPGALAADLGRPVAADNDVNLATLAEHRHGRAAGADDFVFIAVGTGIGMGIVAGGRLQHGATGAAGEIATLPLGGDPYDPANQVRGTLEEAAAGVGVARRYAERAGAVAGSSDPLDLFAAAAAGDVHAQAAIDHQMSSLALAVVAVHSVLDPALVVFGGGLGVRDDLLAGVRDHVARLSRRPIRIEASLLGERAGLVGAAELARDEALARTTGGPR
ncbi:MAG TPA: ROK family protein [Capillimicrobium sp.]|nr:ROK family protein [Capillimicrobium sp.]